MASVRLPLALGDLLRAEQDRHLVRINQLRFFGASAFLALFVILGLVLRLTAWSANLPLFFAYCAIAGAVLWVGRLRARLRPVIGLTVAVLDLPVVFFIQLSTFPHSNPSGVAGFNVGIYVFLLLLAALTLDPWALVVTTVVGILLEVRLQYLAGVDPGAMGASAILLTLTAVGCGYARRRVMDLITRLSAIATEEQAMRDLAQKTREQSYLDALTGLYNRRGFLTLGEQQLAAAARTGVHYVIVFMDLDGLKTINDELGHAVGDEAIREAATVLRQTLRDADLVARLGGDEFVALAADSLETSRGGGRIIERISERLRTFNDGGHRPYKLQMSAGAVSFDPARPRALEALMVDADTAMYAQKKTRPSHRNAPVLASA